MVPSTEISRAQIEHQTALVEYRRARLELAAEACRIVVAVLVLATALVGGITAMVLTLTV